MKQYTLKARFEAVDDEEFKKIVLTLKRGYFKYSFNHSIAPPHHMSFEFEGLSETGVENIKAHFRSMNLKGGNFTTVEIIG